MVANQPDLSPVCGLMNPILQVLSQIAAYSPGCLSEEVVALGDVLVAHLQSLLTGLRRVSVRQRQLIPSINTGWLVGFPGSWIVIIPKYIGSYNPPMWSQFHQPSIIYQLSPLVSAYFDGEALMKSIEIPSIIPYFDG